MKKEFFVSSLSSFILVIFLCFQGCAGVQSGHYIRLQSGETPKKLALKYRVGAEKIKRYNPNASFRSGEVIFLPLERGIFSRDIRAPRSFLDSGSLGSLLKGLQWPVPSSRKISSRFGRRWGKQHNGIDISARRGSTIVAAEAGRVIYSGRELAGFGHMIVIRHQGSFYTLYAHNQKNYVKSGQWVKRGRPIGEVGNSGRSTGYHLHFEVRRGDHPLNPLAFFGKGRSRVASK